MFLNYIKLFIFFIRLFILFLLFQLGTIYIWTIVYNVVRIYSCKISNNEVKVDDSKGNPASQLETDPENISRSQTDHVKQLEIESTVSNGRPKVNLI